MMPLHTFYDLKEATTIGVTDKGTHWQKTKINIIIEFPYLITKLHKDYKMVNIKFVNGALGAKTVNVDWFDSFNNTNVNYA